MNFSEDKSFMWKFVPRFLVTLDSPIVIIPHFLGNPNISALLNRFERRCYHVSSAVTPMRDHEGIRCVNTKKCTKHRV